MNVAEYLVDFLIKREVDHVFGIPGGVVLDLLYAFDARKEITPHLSYHEQAAAFEACGYAQVNHTLGVAYATRGPGFTNMITGIADAYSDSIPVMFITAHSGRRVGHSVRFEKEQELDTVQMVKHITKYAVTIDDLNEVVEKIYCAYAKAVTGRKGPVLLDFSANLWLKELEEEVWFGENELFDEQIEIYEVISKMYMESKKPVILIGDGIRQAGKVEELVQFVNKLNVPVLSSRCSQDIGARCNNYFGYIGSHGLRYSNFIFAKSDFVLALGNRIAFPLESKSFLKAFENKKMVRLDIDSAELRKEILNVVSLQVSLDYFFENLKDLCIENVISDLWITICSHIKEQLKLHDVNKIVGSIKELFDILPCEYTIVTDVGNNEFWVSRGYEIANIKNRILYSKSFAALGCGLGKAIGAYYATKRPILCIVGDQGFQLNIQELQFIAQEKLPIVICVINNMSSGMIKDHEEKKGKHYLIHTTRECGYSSPDLKMIARSYRMQYKVIETENIIEIKEILDGLNAPIILENRFEENIALTPILPKGDLIQDMFPKMNEELYKHLEQL